MAVITDKIINILPLPREQLIVPPEKVDKEVGGPSKVVDLIGELLEKDVSDIPRTSTKVQEIEAAKTIARIFITIFENMRAIIFAFELALRGAYIR